MLKPPSMDIKWNYAPPPPAPASIKEEGGTPPPPPQPSHLISGTAHVKGEPREASQLVGQSADVATPSSEDGREPHFMKSVNQLCSLGIVIHVFRRSWDDLRNHLDFIQNAIDACSKHHHMAIIPATEAAPAPNVPDDSGHNDAAKYASRSELQNLCEMMCSRGLRKYIVSHLSDVAKLREEAPAALKSAPRPAKLVLECVGRFFLQGSKAFNKDSPMILPRQASLLILEYFLLSDCTEIEPSVKQEADLAAIAWRKRLINEGGVSSACDIDARGLILFVGSFGIPAVFTTGDLGHLIRLSNPSEIADALRRAHALLTRIPDIIETMMKNGMNVEAVRIVYTFGVEDKFSPQKILTLFLKESRDAWKRTRREAQGSPIVLNEANEKQLAALKSVMKCLEDHKIDPLKLLPGWQINKDISDLEMKMEEKVISKRKADETESSKKLKNQEVKRSRYTAKVSPSPMISTPIIGLQEQWPASHVDGNSSYDSLRPTNLVDGGLFGQGSSYQVASSIPHGSGVGSFPENILGTMAGSGGGVLAAGVGDGMSAGTSGVPSMGSFAGFHGEIPIDRVGQMMNNNGPQYGWPRVGDSGFNDDRLIGQRFAGQPASIGVNGLFGPSPSLEGFVGLPNHPSTGVSNRSSASDLYQFADAVLEGESYHSSGSRTAGTVPPVVPAHRSSYLY